LVLVGSLRNGSALGVTKGRRPKVLVEKSRKVVNCKTARGGKCKEKKNGGRLGAGRGGSKPGCLLLKGDNGKKSQQPM